MSSPSSAPKVSRRRFLQLTAASGAAVVISTAPGAPLAQATVARKKRAYVVVVDGCRPDEVTSTVTPRLYNLRSHGMNFPNARSLPVMETIPNHTMMMTGVRPDRTGVPANSVYDADEQVVRDLDRPADLQFPTLLQRLRGAGFTTGTVLSKDYLFGIFGTRATYRWEPNPLLPITNHAPDVATMDATISMIDSVDPNFVFVNLGDCDRAGHGDFTGTTTVAASRKAALVSADQQVGRLVTHLRDTGRWANSVVMILADHSMDWSYPHRIVSLHPAFEADPLLAGRVTIAQNGGADLLYWTGSGTQRSAAVNRMREIATGTAGVLAVRPPSQLRLNSLAGDLVAYCKAGWRFSDPAPLSNPIPGNHGHPATEPIPFFIAGGSPLVKQATTSSVLVQTVDVAPTIGCVFGLAAPRGGYDGRSRL